MAPVMHCEEEEGSPYCEQIMMTSAVASSAQNPLDGDSLA
jgi:hypothetical protein